MYPLAYQSNLFSNRYHSNPFGITNLYTIMANTNAQIQTLIADATTLEQLNQIATDNNLTAPTSTELDAARLELQNIVNSHPDTEQTYDSITPELQKALLAEKPLPEGRTSSPFLNKAVYGGQTLDVTLLVTPNGDFQRFIKKSGDVSDHYAALSHDGTKITFLLVDDFNKIRTSGKVVSVPTHSIDAYSDVKAIGAVRFRMPLTQDGQVKAV